MAKNKNPDGIAKIIRVHKEFYDIVNTYIKDFYKSYSIKISTFEATKKISEKIVAQGGLTV